MTKKLSMKQQRVLDFIRKYYKEKGYPPSVREICTGLDLKSTSTAHGYLTRLEERGYIRRDPSRPRAIELLADMEVQRDVVPIPVLGRITAGIPILAQEEVSDVLPLSNSYFHIAEGDAFILNVEGDSMINIGIRTGDQLVVRRSETAENGDIVVALIDEEATCKRFYKEGGYFRLQPENDFMEPIIINEVTILGKVIGLMRRYH